jgi:DNA-directed RNA polymerase specialized sigma24 family protein
VQKIAQKGEWKLTAPAFRRLLEWLDEGTNSDGQKYLEIRGRLVDYFDRKRCSSPDDLADETINRVSRRLEEEGMIESETPARYCYIVARFIFMEHLRGEQKETSLVDDLGRQSRAGNSAAEADEERQIRERMLDCLESCVGQLEARDRQIITRYYVGKEKVKIENRRALADSLSITMNALSIRACRIRDKLEVCVKRCLAARE